MKTNDTSALKQNPPGDQYDLNLELNYGYARTQIKTIFGDENHPITIQYVRDAKDLEKSYPKNSFGTLKELWSEIVHYNRSGYGVHLTVNRTDGLGRKKGNIKGVSAYFFDQDKGELPLLPIKAGLLVKSKNGVHGYFPAQPNQNLKSFTNTQKLIAKALGTDPAVSDVSRAMRLAGTFHLKDLNDPFLVTVTEVNDVSYTEQGILNAFLPRIAGKEIQGLIKNEKKTAKAELGKYFKEQNISKDPSTTNWLSVLDLAGYPYQNESQDKNRYIVKCPNFQNHTSGTELDGSSCIFLNKETVAGFHCFHGHCTKIGIVDLAKQIPSHILAECSEVNKKNSFETMARDFVNEKWASILYHNSSLFVYQGSHYVECKLPWLKAEIARYIQDNNNGIKKISGAVQEILVNVHAIANIFVESIPCWIEDSPFKEEKIIALKSKLFRVNEYLKNPDSSELLVEHTPKYFNLSALPFDYSKEVRSSIWETFLNKMIPDADAQMTLQEFMGLLLIHDTTFNKVLFLCGDGANGKSVVLTVIRCLLGNANVSAVGLEGFNPSRTFPLAQTQGKLANIVAELGEVSRTEEGILKAFSSGDIISVERKFGEHFEMKPTARLVFATNTMPHFKDKTDGIFRRILLIPMKVQILDESKQDKRLIDPKFWESSNEIQGVFNWALEGLARLLNRGRFVESQQSIDEKAKYRTDLNPATQFLDEHIEAGTASDQMSSVDLYRYYKSYCAEQGAQSLGLNNFAKEVRRKFSDVEYTKNAISFRGRRTRCWIGIRPIDANEFEKNRMNAHFGNTFV